MYFASTFAQGGRSAADYLKSKLAQTNSDATIRDIINVFVEMQRQGTYQVAKDAALMQEIQASVDRMKDPDWKRFVERKVSQIYDHSQ